MSYHSSVAAGPHSVLAISSDNFAKNKAATAQLVSISHPLSSFFPWIK
jgi:hypothetical protein